MGLRGKEAQDRSGKNGLRAALIEALQELFELQYGIRGNPII
jgi:hypothetical protein